MFIRLGLGSTVINKHEKEQAQVKPETKMRENKIGPNWERNGTSQVMIIITNGVYYFHQW